MPLLYASSSGIAIIKDADLAPYNMALEGFKSSLNSDITTYVLSKNQTENNKIINDIKTNKPPLILAIGPRSMILLNKEVVNTPIIYCMIMNPETYDFIHNKNVTGITLRIPVKDQIITLKKLLPGLKNLGVIYNPSNSDHIINEAKNVLKDLDINLVTEKIYSEKSVPKAIRKLNGKVDALWLIPDSTVITSSSLKFIILESFIKNLPLMVHSEKFVQAGALVSLTPDYNAIGQQAAKLANSIKNNDITLEPIISPFKQKLIINNKTALKMRIIIPEEMIKYADKVFE